MILVSHRARPGAGRLPGRRFEFNFKMFFMANPPGFTSCIVNCTLQPSASTVLLNIAPVSPKLPTVLHESDEGWFVLRPSIRHGRHGTWIRHDIHITWIRPYFTSLRKWSRILCFKCWCRRNILNTSLFSLFLLTLRAFSQMENYWRLLSQSKISTP